MHMRKEEPTSSSCSCRPPLVSTKTKHCAPSNTSASRRLPFPCFTERSYVVRSINSNADKISDRSRLTFWNRGRTLSKWGKARRTLLVAWGAGGVRMETPVMIPNVPSDPMKSCFKSYPISLRSALRVWCERGESVPVLSLRMVLNWSRMVPSGKTTSRPRTEPWREP